MRHVIFISLIALCVSGTNAQSIGPSTKFGVQANLGFVSLPGPEINGSHPLEEVYTVGYGGGAHLDIDLITIALRISADYTTFSPDNGKYQEALASFNPAASGITVDGGAVNIISANVDGKVPFLPLPIFSPYFTGGLGIAKISADNPQINGQAVTTSPGFDSGTSASANLGIGVDFNLILSLYIEAKYIVIFDEGESSRFIPVSLGATF